MQKRFFAHVLPAMLAFLFSGLYTIVDGFFIGQNMGDVGLAAITIAFPLASVIQAVGTGIGMGAAVQIAICRGEGDLGRERRLLERAARPGRNRRFAAPDAAPRSRAGQVCACRARGSASGRCRRS